MQCGEDVLLSLLGEDSLIPRVITDSSEIEILLETTSGESRVTHGKSHECHVTWGVGSCDRTLTS